MENQTNWTPFPDDNLLGLTDKNQINEFEAPGLAKAELFTFELETDVEISTTLILEIHPFNNGNGRTGRILMNLIALKFGYQPLELYYREGESRKFYINAMKSADSGNFKILTELISEELIPF